MSKADASKPERADQSTISQSNAVKAYFFDAALSSEPDKKSDEPAVGSLASPFVTDTGRNGAGKAHFFPNADAESVNLGRDNLSARDDAVKKSPDSENDKDTAKKPTNTVSAVSNDKKQRHDEKQAESRAVREPIGAAKSEGKAENAGVSQLLSRKDKKADPPKQTISDTLSSAKNNRKASSARKPNEAERADMGRLLGDRKREGEKGVDSIRLAQALDRRKSEHVETKENSDTIGDLQADTVSVTPEQKSGGESRSRKKENDALLSALRASDIKGEAPPAAKRLYPVVRRILMGVLLVVLIAASCNLLYSMYSRKKADAFYTALRERFYADLAEPQNAVSIGTLAKDGGSTPDAPLYSDSGDIYVSPDITAEDLHTLYTRMQPSLAALKEVNSSVFGWIKVEGTRVDYPVVRSPRGNNDYYLTHALDLTYSDSGSIFMDYANNTELSKNRNTCVYGHNMNDGTMFQTIMNFRSIEQFRNGQIYVYTQSGIYVYTPFAVYDAVPTDSFFHVDFESDAAFSEFLTEIRQKSLFASTVVPKSSDKIITLITCTNTLVDKRFVVHGVLSDIVK